MSQIPQIIMKNLRYLRYLRYLRENITKSSEKSTPFTVHRCAQ